MDKKTVILDEFDKKNKLYYNFAMKVRQLLEEIIDSESISYNAITYRVKERESLSKKIDVKQDKYNALEEITDVAGVRIITYYSDDVDKVVSLIEKEFEVDRENSIDKGKSLEPDRFGYCSVHYIVGLNPERLKLRENKQYKGLKCEIQVRTVLQHAWAEIEHDLGYKSEKGLPKEIRRNFSRLAGLLEIADKEFLEIRTYLTDYEGAIAEKISEKAFDNRELDSIILKEFIKTDTDIARINKEIEKNYGSEVKKEIRNYSCENILNKLRWLGVNTLGQLKELAVKGGDAAIKIAEIILTPPDNPRLAANSFVESTIGAFYLCYAKLLMDYHDTESIKNFVDIFSGQSASFVNKLINIQKQLGL